MLIEDGATVNANPDCQTCDWQIQSFAAEVWVPQLKKSSRSWSLSERYFRKYIQPYLGSRKFSALGKKDVAAWLAHVEALGVAPATRNRVMFVLVSLIKLAFERKLLPSEILADFLKKNLARQERHNSALIESGKMRQLWRKLGQSPMAAARVIEILLLTGASKSEILSARWENLDLEHNQLQVDGYNGKKRKIWLGPQTMKIFAAIARNPESPWIFPGRKPEKHITDIFLFWNELRKSCGLENLRIQDLRHNHVNWQNLREGYSPAIESEVRQGGQERPECDRENIGLPQRVAIAAVYARANDAGVQAESARDFLAGLACKFINDPAFARTTLKKSRCGFFLGLDAASQRDFSLEICMERLAGASRADMPVSPAGFFKGLCKLRGPAIAVEAERYPVREALRLAEASILSGNMDMALVGGMAAGATDSANRAAPVNGREGVLIVLTGCARPTGRKTRGRQIFLESCFHDPDQIQAGGKESGASKDIGGEISGFMRNYENLLDQGISQELHMGAGSGKRAGKPFPLPEAR